MLIKKINIKQYKNLKDCEIEINNNQQVLSFIGTNGSGKSNLLEAISVLFKDAFIPRGRESKTEKYQISLSYNTHADKTKLIELSTKNTKISCKKGTKTIHPSSFTTEQILPKRIVAIYSGESDRLNNKAYVEIYKKYVREIKRSSLESPKMIYLDKSFLDISLLSLLLENDEEDVIEINQLKINKKDVKIVFNINTNKLRDYKKSKAKKIVESISMQKEYSFDELKQKIENLVETEEIDKNSMFVYLYSTKDVLDKIKIFIKINDTYIELDDLSEGEKKKILVKSALECIGTEDTLFLLDEPDAYIHLSNKEELTKIINENKHNSTIILTTHSPTFTKSLSETFPDSIYKMEQNKKIETVSSKIKALRLLCPEQDIFKFLFSNKDILLVEGKTDVKYITNAIIAFNEELNKYTELSDLSIISMGGTDYESYELFMKNFDDKQRFIILVDRDTGGRDIINHFINKECIDKPEICPIYSNVCLVMLPGEKGIMIEDFVSREKIRKCFCDNIKSFDKGNLTIKKYFKLNTTIDGFKKALCGKCNDIEDFKGFKIILDLILEARKKLVS